MKNERGGKAAVRRDQIIAAAAAVIARKGIQNLSLSEIESMINMSRGQLTYYFRSKEEILLAVFDRMLEMMDQQHCESDGGGSDLPWLEVLESLMRRLTVHPPAYPEFHALQFTFLSQISHRADFREKLSNLYERWRQKGIDHLTQEYERQPSIREAPKRAMATLVQAVLHGLAIQAAADPDRIEADAAIRLCLDLIQSYLWPTDMASSGSAANQASRRDRRTPSSAPSRSRSIGERSKKNGVHVNGRNRKPKSNTKSPSATQEVKNGRKR